VRAIGVANLKSTHLETLMKRTDLVPVVKQIEVHRYFLQRVMQATVPETS
jgi:diketogulonate reductase-like aldo/keto reductase